MVNDIKQLRYLFLILAFCIIIFAVCFFTSCINQTKSLGDIKEGKITKIVDGDTFYVDTFSERIRIIGVDCPEIDTAEGQKAASYTKSLLKVGQKV
ncbi:MAG: hypothetical protein Q4F54_02810 [Coriobacteriia bacterium]|nr:hypothetical protein [Coriobacteriia bacterium]